MEISLKLMAGRYVMVERAQNPYQQILFLTIRPMGMQWG